MGVVLTPMCSVSVALTQQCCTSMVLADVMMVRAWCLHRAMVWGWYTDVVKVWYFYTEMWCECGTYRDVWYKCGIEMWYSQRCGISSTYWGVVLTQSCGTSVVRLTCLGTKRCSCCRQEMASAFTWESGWSCMMAQHTRHDSWAVVTEPVLPATTQ